MVVAEEDVRFLDASLSGVLAMIARDDQPALVRVHVKDTLGDLLQVTAPELGMPLQKD